MLKQLLAHRWVRRLLAVLTALLVIAMLTHPELRLLAPVFDALGIDGLLLLASAPLLASLRALPWHVWHGHAVWWFLECSAVFILTWEQLRSWVERSPWPPHRT